MKKRTCIYPRRAVNVMKAFLAEASPKICECHYIPTDAPNAPDEKDFDDVLDYLSARWDWEAENGIIEFVGIEPKLYKVKNPNFCVHSGDYFNDGEMTVRFGYHYDCLFDNNPNGTLVIIKDMAERGKHMKGFSRITKILLHELGHLATYVEVHDKYSSEELWQMKQENHMKGGGNKGYIRLPNEYAATQWAIEWLTIPENRKMAKAFEKKFWACFTAD